MSDFYSRDRSKAFDELKEELYARLKYVTDSLSTYSENYNIIDADWQNGVDDTLMNEERWLRGMLDKIERS